MATATLSPRSTAPPRTWALPLALLTVVCALLFFHRLGDRELASSHEARAAQNAQTMLDTGDWGLPRLFDRRAELQKPPLYYWLVAAVAWLMGGRVDGWAVRLPAALSALGTVLVVFGLCARRGRPVAGLVAGAVLATSLHFTWLARVGRIDMPLTLTVALALAGFHLGQCRREEGRGGWPCFLFAYVGVGVGLLLKGPIAAVLPAVVVAVYALLDRGAGRPPVPLWRAAHELGLWWGLPLIAVIAAPWYLWANATTDGEWFRVFFWHHNVQRGLGGEGLATHPWWFYGARLAVDLLPWGLALPLAGWYLWRFRGADAQARLGAAWLLAMLVFLSCMRFKRADYLLPAYPGAALLLGCAAERLYRRARRPHRLAVALGLVVALCAAGWVGHVEALASQEEQGRPDRRFAEAIRQHTRERVLFFRTEAHALAFHVGRPMHTILEWENLDIWAGKPAPVYIVMPLDCASEWRSHLTAGGLVEVLRTDDLTPHPHDRPLILMRTVPPD